MYNIKGVPGTRTANQWGIIPAKRGLACDVIKVSISLTSEVEVGFFEKNSFFSFLMGSHKQPVWLKNKKIAVLETRINLLSHCVCRFFSDATIFFNDLTKTANVTTCKWDNYQKSAVPLMSLRSRIFYRS